jgi:hypothetical protein
MITDLRKKVADIIEQYGHNIIYVRRIPQLHCKCWVEKTKSANPRCPICLGTGVKIYLEIHKVCDRSSVPDSSSGAALNYEAPGVSHEPSYFFYMLHDVNPGYEDIILDVIWNGNIPQYLTMPYQVSFPEPFRGQNGRVEYWRVATRALSHAAFNIETIRKIGFAGAPVQTPAAQPVIVVLDGGEF